MRTGQFVGEYPCKTDNKWRLNIPSEIYKVLERVLKYDRENAIYQQLNGNRLVCYTPNLYYQRSKKILGLHKDSKTRRNFFRKWYRAEVDKQQRILLHPSFRQNAKRGLDLLILGNGDVFEIEVVKNDK